MKRNFRLLSALFVALFFISMLSCSAFALNDHLKPKSFKLIKANKIIKAKFSKKNEEDKYRFYTGGGKIKIILWDTSGRKFKIDPFMADLYEPGEPYDNYESSNCDFDVSWAKFMKFAPVAGDPAEYMWPGNNMNTFSIKNSKQRQTKKEYLDKYKKGSLVGLTIRQINGLKGSYKFKIICKSYTPKTTKKTTKKSTKKATKKVIKTYKIKFNCNGGKSGSKKVITRKLKKGSKYGKLPTPKRSGYKLKGWYTKEKGGTTISKNTKAKKSCTVYAQWKANTAQKITLQHQTDKYKGGYLVLYGSDKKFSLKAKTNGGGKLSYSVEAPTTTLKQDFSGKITVVHSGVAYIKVTASESGKYKKTSKKFKLSMIDKSIVRNSTNNFINSTGRFAEFSDFCSATLGSIDMINVLETHYGMVPQGICETEDYVLMSAYHAWYDDPNKHSPVLSDNSSIFVFDKDSGKYLKEIKIRGSNDIVCWSIFSHVGGIDYDYDTDTVYIANSSEMLNISGESDDLKNTIWKLPLSRINTAVNSSGASYNVIVNKAFKSNVAASCITIYDGIIYVGQFNEKEESKNKMQGYRISDYSAVGSTVSLPFKTQGIAINGDTAYCSTSFGRGNKSKLYIMDVIRDNDGTIVSLDEVRSIVAPNMMEDIDYDIDYDELYVAFESAAYKYVYTNNACDCPLGRIVILDGYDLQ